MSRRVVRAKKGKKGSVVSAGTNEIASGNPALTNQDNTCPFDYLLDELIISIFKDFKLTSLEKLSLVCQRWRQLTFRQELWRFHAIKKWGDDVVPNSYAFTSDSVQVDLKKYLIPTNTSGKTTAVDWRKYFKIRFFFEDAKSALDRHFYLMREDADPFDFNFGPGTFERKILVPEGMDGLDPYMWDEWDVVDESWDSDSESYDFGDYLDEADEKIDEMDVDESSENIDGPVKNYTEDLHTSSISKFFLSLPQEKKNKYDLPERFPRLLTCFAVEVFPLLVKANMHVEVLMACMGIFRSVEHFWGDFISQSIYDLIPLVEDKPTLMAQLVFAACQTFSKGPIFTAEKQLFKNLLTKLVTLGVKSVKNLELNKEFSEFLRKTYNVEEDKVENRLEQVITYATKKRNLHTIDKEHAKMIKQSMTTFVDPLNKYEYFRITLQFEQVVPLIAQYSSHKNELAQALIDFIVEKFHESNHDSEKVILLTLSDVLNVKSLDFCLKVFPLACEATKDKNDKVAFAAYTLLYRKMSTTLASQFPKKLISTMFETLLRGLDRFPTNSLCLIVMLVKLLKDSAKIVSDKQLEQLNSKIIANMTDPKEFFHKDVLLTSEYFLFDKFHQLGDIFGERMKPYLPKYRTAIMDMGKVEVYSAVKLTKKKDRVLLEMNSTPQRWIQYCLLGRTCGGEEFEKEEIQFVKELLKIRDQKWVDDDDEDNVEGWCQKTLFEFHALFGDVLCKVIGTKAKKKLKEHVERMLEFFSKEISQFGAKFFTVQETGNGYFPELPMPPTSTQFETAMGTWRLQKLGKEKLTENDAMLFRYVYSNQFRDQFTEKAKKQELEKKPKKGKKPKEYSPALNDVLWEERCRDMDVLCTTNELKQFTYQIAINNLAIVVDKITDDVQLLKAFHIILAFAKSDDAKLDLIDQVFRVYYRLNEKFDESTQCFYVNTLANILGNRLHKPITKELRGVIYDLGHKLISEFYSIQDMHNSPMIGLVSFLVQFDVLPPNPQRYPLTTYESLPLLMLKSPLGLYQAFQRCPESGFLFADHPEDKPLDPQYALRLHTLAYLGFHFGIRFLWGMRATQMYNLELKVKRIPYDDLGDRIVDYLKQVDRSELKPQQIDRMERFLVLYRITQQEGLLSPFRDVNLYNAAYYETAAVKKIIRSKKFTTGMADLDKRIKKWDGVYDLTKTVFYGEDWDEEYSDSEDSS